jgi:hypothetical protein
VVSAGQCGHPVETFDLHQFNALAARGRGEKRYGTKMPDKTGLRPPRLCESKTTRPD